MAAGEDAATLTLSPEKVCFIILKAREFDAKDEVTEPDPGSNPSDDNDAAVLEDHTDDPVVEELTSLIDSLSEDEQIDLVTLTWLGPVIGQRSAKRRHALIINAPPITFLAHRFSATSWRKVFPCWVIPALNSKWDDFDRRPEPGALEAVIDHVARCLIAISPSPIVRTVGAKTESSAGDYNVFQGSIGRRS